MDRLGWILLGISMALAAACGGSGGKKRPDQVFLSGAAFDVTEDRGTLDIRITRMGSRAVTVDYATADGTATAGADYAATVGTVSWASGEAPAKTISIPILDDLQVESDETFQISLSNIQGRAAFSVPHAATITILDNDCVGGSLVADFGTGGVVTSNPSGAWDSAWAIATDGAYLYAAGWDEVSGNYGWRVEKRSLVDGSPDLLFGGGGFVRSDPSTAMDLCYSVAVDADFIYLGGFDSSPASEQWRIEKRFKADGSLDGGFGTAGVVTEDPTASDDMVRDLEVDDTFIYAVGQERTSPDQWRIEKRWILSGDLDGGFGTAGVVHVAPGGSRAEATCVAVDASYMYVIGIEDSPGSAQWRIEKMSLADGTPDAGFGLAGAVTSDPSTGSDEGRGICLDGGFLYAVGHDSTLGSYAWRMEKRSLVNGTLDPGFGLAGVVSSDPSPDLDRAYGIAADGTHFYTVGTEMVGGSQWRVEKRSLADGSLDLGFGTGGVVSSDPGPNSDAALCVAVDGAAIYVAGKDENQGSTNDQFRIEKRCK